jgi:hypothetical protein
MTIRRYRRCLCRIAAAAAFSMLLAPLRLPAYGAPVEPATAPVGTPKPAAASAESGAVKPAAGSASGSAAVSTAQSAPLPQAFQPTPIPLGHGLLVGGALDLRAQSATAGSRTGTSLNAVEVDLQHPLTSKGVPRGNIVLQVIGEDPIINSREADVQLGEAYLLYKLPLHNDTGTTAFVKIGQFQIPFGLLAVYDPHLRVVQPIYSEALGLRTDWGAAVSGSLYGYLQYDFALTTGTGPNHADVDPNRLVTLRLGRTFVTRNGVVTLCGRAAAIGPRPRGPRRY